MSNSSVINEFNKAINEILVHDKVDNTIHGKVCLVCDKFLREKEYCTMKLSTFLKYAPYFKGPSNIPNTLRKVYHCSDVSNNRIATEILSQCLLSPRSKVIYKNDKRNLKPFVMCCAECKSGLTFKKLGKGELPRFAIANNLTIGHAPECLEKLNEIELALISQARFRGHLFTYWGGCHRSIKGWHSFYDVDPSHTTSVLQQVSALTESDNIAVVLYGPFTRQQRKKILDKVQVNIPNVLEAFKWLKENNKLYADVPIPDPGMIGNPTIIDNSREVEAENSDIELKEEIKVIFPDGTIHTGGCHDREAFERTVADIRSKCGSALPYLTSRPSQKILRDYKDMNLMKAFPKQFPYGFGYHADFNIQCSQNGYLKHLLSLSIPAFHEADFVLVIHNMFEKSRALSGALWQVRGNEKCDVTEEELNVAISRQQRGLPPGNGPGQKFLDSVKAVKRSMAHTNSAAQAAQAKFLSLTHHFGCPKVLFTVSFDDSLDFRILPLSGKKDTMEWISFLGGLSHKDLAAEMESLKAIRYKYPGICALNFETLLDIVLSKIVGDNDLRTGVFGKLEAYGVAVEEQGKKTLHAHILVYILGWNETLTRLHSVLKSVRKKAMKEIIEFVDACISTELKPGYNKEVLCFECKQESLNFYSPQQLRFLRHKEGCKFHQGIIASCNNCEAKFRGNEVALKKVLPTLDTSQLSDEELAAFISYKVLKATAPMTHLTTMDTDSLGLINYQFNHHLDQHTKTCFKKGVECRMNLPDVPEEETRVVLSDKLFEVFKWNGEKQLQHNVTIRPRRLQHDAFTNTYCKIMSGCKAPCNSNVGVTTGARSTIYTSCYSSKGTQREDTDEYFRMASYVGNRFQHERKTNTLFEGLSRLMGAVIVGTSEHVCAAPMAAYLVRNQSRFRFSANFKYIPIRELASILSQKIDSTNINMAVLGHDKGCFLTNEALHYLQRPKFVEQMCVVDFFREFEVIRKSQNPNSVQPTYDFDDKDHPGFDKQVLRKRHPSNVPLPQIPHWVFPDAASFGGNIFDLQGLQVNFHVEKFCQTVLILYHPFRVVGDLCINGSYHQKFLAVFPTKRVPPHIQSILNNIQMFYNSMRLPAREDPLNETTRPYTSPNGSPSDNHHTDESWDDTFVEGIFDFFNPSPFMESTHRDFCLLSLRKAGARRCGFEHLPSMKSTVPAMASGIAVQVQNQNVPATFISTLSSTSPPATFTNTATTTASLKRDRPSLNTLMTLTYRSTRRRLNNGSLISTSQVDADGTAQSILEWSKLSTLNFDATQMRAFQIVTAAFVLTYYDDAQDVQNAQISRHNFNHERNQLKKLATLSKAKPHLRMFLDGPAGSGKSHVVKALLQYAETYTKNLGVTFDMRTIVVTALSGVAATSIGGETLHSAAAFNRNIDCEKDRSWINARLLIIDECSFMSVSQIEKLDVNLRTLLHRHNTLFGGIHILFCGDFRQLEPTAGTPLYSQKHSDKKWINSINCYLELQGLHRFKDDPEWGMILRRIRNATHTHLDIAAVDACLIGTRVIPNDASYCVYGNCDRSAINAGIFSNLITQRSTTFPLLPDDIIVVRGSNVQRVLKNGSKVYLEYQDLQYIFQNCGDCQLHTGGFKENNQGHFVDPFLKLYHHIPLMFVSNDDVPNGHANGTRVILQSVVLKPSFQPDTISIDGQQCHSIDADSIEYIICTLDGNSSKVFHVRPRAITCHVRVPVPNHFGATSNVTINFKLVMTQLPLLVNNATTGHKLQGQTKKNLVISVWSKKRNWNYVALSRVTARKGLFLVSPLPPDVDFSMSPDLTQMLQILRQQQPQDDPDFQQL